MFRESACAVETKASRGNLHTGCCGRPDLLVLHGHDAVGGYQDGGRRAERAIGYRAAEKSSGRGFMNRPGTVYASPVAVGTRIYLLTRSGAMLFSTPFPNSSSLPRTSRRRAGSFDGTPAVSDGQLFFGLRGQLYCVADTQEQLAARPASAVQSQTKTAGVVSRLAPLRTLRGEKETAEIRGAVPDVNHPGSQPLD